MNMHELSAGKIIIRKSRFYAHLYTIEHAEQINEIIQKHHSMYAKANHHCYALQVKDQQGLLHEASSDDGEVGRTGKILAQVLQKHHLQSHAIVVSRIFGGVKLGVGGVSRAFRQAAEGVIELYTQR
jgi:putative IMPACT (imprinted ancient) family translation regulator